MERVILILRRNGYKITPQRRAVIMALTTNGKFATAHQVLAYVKTGFPDMSLDTVYRNLSLLVELGVVHEIKTRGREGNLFEITTDEHHHHLVCITCGKAECLDFCPIHAEDLDRAEKSGFKITSHALEFYGYCRECRTAV
ncbi:Zinc-specific metallo-regulatory protein [bioreactor metagenome]|uniref:Zinc-specific metallo-regulatory protein n=1 Tax=bioreactor metagenome TaxID=1076179 RepID=A0A645CPQ9_9ZZZZ